MVRGLGLSGLSFLRASPAHTAASLRLRLALLVLGLGFGEWGGGGRVKILRIGLWGLGRSRLRA